MRLFHRIAQSSRVKTLTCVDGFGSLLVGCGANSPTGPSNSTPNVVGSYTGNITIAYPELGQSLVCPASTTVTQSGTTVSAAPIVLRGECGSLSIPVGQDDEARKSGKGGL